ncbi:MAG: SH3 domain-containing protein [Oscillatoria sp. SIO1A7]|nr:SH3 domain-containing protein [Oscillatoria sp. SIO1A7]
MLRILYGIIKFLIGFVLALAILTGGSVAAALYFVTKLTALPPRPSFPNDQTAIAATKGSQPKASPEAKKEGPVVRVIWPDGLILRDSAGYDAQSIGGIAFNERAILLETTPDKEWEKVRVEQTNEEGWVKGGNTERVN